MKLSTNENVSIGYIRNIIKYTCIGTNISSTRNGTLVTLFTKYKNYKIDDFDQNISKPKNMISAIFLIMSSWNFGVDFSYERLFSKVHVRFASSAILNLKKKSLDISSGIINTFYLPFSSYPILLSLIFNAKGFLFGMIGINLDRYLRVGLGLQVRSRLLKFGLFIDV